MTDFAARIRELAQALGFSFVGFTGPELPDSDRHHLAQWLDKKRHGGMAYMDRPGIDRCHARTVLPSARSVVMVALDYSPNHQIPENNGQAAISCYAQGPDYHVIIKDRLKLLATQLKALKPELEARPFVDTAPLVERAFAREAGLGWIGKNACLLAKGRGSYFFLAGLALNIELPANDASSAHCGSCRACLDACPTGALLSPYELDARLCISYLTIEHRGAWPEHLREAVGPHVFGCDICQAVCPWNRFSEPAEATVFGQQPHFQPGPLTALFEAAMQSFKGLTRNTAATRAGKKGLLRNIATAMGNAALPEFKEPLERLMKYEDDGVQEHARWARERLS